MNTSLQPSHVWGREIQTCLSLLEVVLLRKSCRAIPRWNIQNSDLFPKWQVRSHGSLTGYSFNLNYTNTANTSATSVSATATTVMVWSVQDSIMLPEQNQFWKSGITENHSVWTCRGWRGSGAGSSCQDWTWCPLSAEERKAGKLLCVSEVLPPPFLRSKTHVFPINMWD